MCADGSAARTVYSRQAARVGDPVFSLNGQQLLFAADSTDFQNEQVRQLNGRLYRLNQTGQTSKLAGTNDLEPRYLPIGAASVIFTNTDNTGLGQRTVYTADGRTANELSDAFLLRSVLLA